MLDTLAHRGPDGMAHWRDGSVALGQCVQATTPQEAGSPPSLNGTVGPLAIAADARLDNRAALVSALGLAPRQGRHLPDHTLILHAYEQWGVNCAERLVGAFAFVIWDGRTRRLYCARDHVGLRPLYYYRSADVLAVASEIKALLGLPEVSRQPNEVRIADYLQHMTQDKEGTFYADVHRLPPAHTLTVTPDRIHRRQYWALDPDRELELESDAAYAERYKTLFTQAVEDRLRSASPVGSCLSGGLDSSSVTCVARALSEIRTEHPLDTFSLVFDEVPASDERPYIEAVLEQEGLQPHFIQGDELDPFEALDQMLWHLDEPFFTPNLFLNWHLLHAAQRQGVGVLLDGFLGDNVVSHGSRLLTELAVTGRWGQLAREISYVVAQQGGSWRTAGRLMRRFVLKPIFEEPVHRVWSHAQQSVFPQRNNASFMDRDLARRIRWRERARAFGEEGPKTRWTARGEHHDDLTSGVIPGALEIANKAAAAFGIEPRFPFADRRLMEYCLAVPPMQKCRNGKTRDIARRGLADYLPDRIRTRHGKANLHPNFVRSTTTLGKEQLDAMIYDDMEAAAEYVDISRVRAAYRGVQQGASDEILFPIWRAAVLAHWLNWEEKASDTTHQRCAHKQAAEAV